MRCAILAMDVQNQLMRAIDASMPHFFLARSYHLLIYVSIALMKWIGNVNAYAYHLHCETISPDLQKKKPFAKKVKNYNYST